MAIVKKKPGKKAIRKSRVLLKIESDSPHFIRKADTRTRELVLFPLVLESLRSDGSNGWNEQAVVEPKYDLTSWIPELNCIFDTIMDPKNEVFMQLYKFVSIKYSVFDTILNSLQRTTNFPDMDAREVMKIGGTQHDVFVASMIDQVSRKRDAYYILANNLTRLYEYLGTFERPMDNGPVPVFRDIIMELSSSRFNGAPWLFTKDIEFTVSTLR